MFRLLFWSGIELVPPVWQVNLFGALRASDGSRSVTQFRTQKTAALLAYLALHRRHPHPREHLTELLWPEDDPAAGRGSLNTAIWWLRRCLEQDGTAPGPVLLADRFRVGLVPGAVSTDVDVFETAIAAADSAEGDDRLRHLTTAVESYTGELLPGFYEEWILTEQARLSERYFQTVCRLVGHLERSGDVDAAIQYALHAVRLDPLRESAHAELMRLLIRSGQPQSALDHYRSLERLYRLELDAAPGAVLCELVRQAESGSVRTARATTPLPAFGPALIGGSAGGVIPLESPLYVSRAADAELRAALEARESIIRVEGPRYSGKTSLLARGLQLARGEGRRVVLTDLQKLGPTQLASADALMRALAGWLAEELELSVTPSEIWRDHRGAARNLDVFLRRAVLREGTPHLVWAVDEADRLFEHPLGAEVFRLFRSWHNERVLEPGGVWSRLTLVLAYSTNAILFIGDLNQSPFNVGARVCLEPFTIEQVTALNEQFRRPLRTAAELQELLRFLGGNPYLIRHGLQELRQRGIGLDRLKQEAPHESGPFGDVLRWLRGVVCRFPDAETTLRALLRGAPEGNEEGFYRLRSAGLVTGPSSREARLSCELYFRYFERALG